MSSDTSSPNCDISVPLLKNNGKTNPLLNKNGNQPKQTSIDQTHNPNSSGVDFIYPPLQDYIEGKQPHDINNGSALANGKFSSSQPQRDLSAMSVLSLLDNKKELDSAMDTNKDLEEILVPTHADIDDISELDTKDGAPFEDHQTNSSLETKTKVVQLEHSVYSCPRPTIYFNDGKRSVDFVLVWDTYKPEASCIEAQNKRKTFESNLIKEGLELEYLTRDQNGLQFIKVHAPNEVLRRYSEILKLRMPMKEDLCCPSNGSRQSRLYTVLSQKLLGRQRSHTPTSNFIVEKCSSQWEKVKRAVFIDTDIFPEIGHRFTAIYSRDKEYLFDADSPCFFTPAIHSRIVKFIFDRKRFSDNASEDFAFGIERLLNDGIYAAAYPLHDGDLKQPGSMRKLLYDEWGAVGKWYRFQPLDYIKEYFGVKIALYFAWLGFYTNMLLPASLVGLICFIYSCITMYSHEPCQDICNEKFNATMCPQCDDRCDYWFLNSGSCAQFRMTYLFDNTTTVFFAVFMSIWAAIFLEMWKRYSAEITHRWDLTGFDVQEEHPRPQYLARLSHVKRKQINIITNTMEPHVPFWRLRVPATIFSFSVVLLLIMLAFATVAGVILYRISVIAALRVHGVSMANSDYITLFTTITAASINLCCIVLFNWLYSYLAEYLTELEFIRTESEFDDSLTLKIYLLQFVNYYASIFYIAFFKGKFIGHPKSYIRIFGHRQEECAPDGCLMELCIQLAIIMIGKQAVNSILEMLFPLFYKWLNSLKLGNETSDFNCKGKTRWIKDFKLVQWDSRSLFPEYLEMVLQYGFVTIFVAAFPLAPLFAMLNNVLEMRLDARKLLTYYRRPVTQRVRDIGVWYRILDSIGKLSVVTNGFIIAFTSNFIPRLVYRLHVSKDFSLNGYLEHSLAVFNTSDFKANSNPDIKICRYSAYREPPGSPNEYKLTLLFWHILAARLAFVVVFENVVAGVIILVKWLIPDIPGTLRDQIRRENYITNEIIISQETMRAKESVTCERLDSPPIVRRVVLDAEACPTSSEDWDQIIDKSLTASDIDYLVHSNTYPDEIQKNYVSGELQTPTSV